MLRARGIIDPVAEKLAEYARRPIEEFMIEYEDFLTSKRNSVQHIMGNIPRKPRSCRHLARPVAPVLFRSPHQPEWRNWQTRRAQNPFDISGRYWSFRRFRRARSAYYTRRKNEL